MHTLCYKVQYLFVAWYLVVSSLTHIMHSTSPLQLLNCEKIECVVGGGEMLVSYSDCRLRSY